MLCQQCPSLLHRVILNVKNKPCIYRKIIIFNYSSNYNNGYSNRNTLKSVVVLHLKYLNKAFNKAFKNCKKIMVLYKERVGNLAKCLSPYPNMI